MKETTRRNTSEEKGIECLKSKWLVTLILGGEMRVIEYGETLDLIRDSVFLLGIIYHQHSLTMVKRVAHESTEELDTHLPLSPNKYLAVCLLFFSSPHNNFDRYFSLSL